MANIKSILDSVRVRYGVVQFPSRYAAREVMEVMADLCCYSRSEYRILAMKDSAWHVVYLTRSGTLFDVEDLSALKSDLGA